MNDEAHIPTEQGSPKKDIRISRPDENRQWPQSNQPPPPRRPKDTKSLKANRFPKRLKLRKRFEFQKTTKQGRRIVGKLICVDWIASGREEMRLGITVSSRYADAHERNLFKRRIREVFRSSRANLPKGLDINVLPRQLARTTTYINLRHELISILEKIC